MAERPSDSMGTPEATSTPPQKKYTKKLLLGLVVAIIVICIIAFLMLRGNGAEGTLNGYRATILYTTHSPQGNVTYTRHYNFDTWKSYYDPGSPFYIDYPFYNNVSGGTTMVTTITCQTPGFQFLNSAQPMPFSVPTALNASTTNNNILVRLTFSTPATISYNGPFLYTVSFDYYPPE